jgi:1-deoxy-D-xylulose-5-phosphate reductoisomerase
MRTPIQYAMTYPRRLPRHDGRLDLASLGRMHFEAPDPVRFPALRLGHEVARRGGTAGAALNAANEAAVDAFRAGRLRFGEIVPCVEDVLRRHAFIADPDLAQLTTVDAWARREVEPCCSPA